MATGILTPLQLIAGSGLLQNQGLGSSPELAASIAAYKATPLMAAYWQALDAGAPVGGLTANTVPALSDSVPTAYQNQGTVMTTTVTAQSVYDAGSGDISKFIQAFNLVSGYGQLTNQFINSAVNSQTYLGGTFTSTNDMITGDITTINLATSAFGQDMIKLGNLINLDNLGALGSPLSLIQSIVQLTGNIPVLSLLLLSEGVSQDIVLNLTNPTIDVTDSVQKLMYSAMTKINGTELTQILKVLKITTANIETMADLLNPVKLFPNSYQSLTVVTANGTRAIYLNSQGVVNSTLAFDLPAYVISAFNRLQQIIPSDQALANKALSVALAQINGINTTPFPVFANTVANTETTRDLPLITALTTAVPPSVADYYTSTLAIGAGPNNTIQVVDVIGLAGGWVATDAFTETVKIFSTMNLTYLTLIYQTIANCYNGTYGDPELGPVTIPPGLPAAGTYYAVTEPNPTPPPPDIVVKTAAESAYDALYPYVTSEVNNLIAQYPSQTTELNTLFNNIGQQLVLEDTLLPIVHLDYADLQANDRNAIYSFIQSLPNYGTQTEVGGMAWFLEAMADLTTLSGEAVVGCLRQGRNQVALSASGIYTNTQIPSDPIPPPAQAQLLPSVYTEAEVANIIVK